MLFDLVNALQGYFDVEKVESEHKIKVYSLDRKRYLIIPRYFNSMELGFYVGLWYGDGDKARGFGFTSIDFNLVKELKTKLLDLISAYPKRLKCKIELIIPTIFQNQDLNYE